MVRTNKFPDVAKERPILLNAEMVRAVLDGRKTQARRIMKVQPDSPNFGLLRITDSTKRSDIGKYHWAESNATGKHTRSALFTCPFGAVGDRLWIRETWQGPLVSYDDAYSMFKDPKPYQKVENCVYRADGDQYPEFTDADDNLRQGWRPSIHMPRWASRITLEITGVRVERLNSMKEQDAIAEGCSGGHNSIPGYHYSATPHEHFHHVWQSICGEESWQANPWVWVIEFKRVEANHDN
ncbi:hypothetical protein [Pantoea ananatis]|uniref:hypothetical protein n=1 Tax=Pantoea ananas TaxID=553 RepID=UPI001B312E79|nr:hypothetical protein [Pantoea ananatis]